jgi:hypothetical protein
MHRFILDPPEDREVDHINHNRLDNQKFNLRVCTKEENQYNAVLRKDNKSGYKGVYLKGDKWYTSIVYAGKQIYLGRFLTAKEGALAYNEAAKKYYGNFAKLNSDII